MNSRAKTGLFLAFCSSLGAHCMAYASLAKSNPEPTPRDLVSEVSIEVNPLPPAATPPNSLPPPAVVTVAAKPVAAATTQLSRSSVVASAPPTASSPSPAPVAALDLSGVTLTNDTSAGFPMPIGDGSSLHGPIGMSRRAPEAARSATKAPVALGPTLVTASDLSVHPVPPALGKLLRANYPEEARQRGLRGAAGVRARVDADGMVRVSRVVSETAPGFGAACRRTLQGSRWSAPRDKNGREVATEIIYTCHFEVDQ